MSVPSNPNPDLAAGGMLGPANSVMSSIFELGQESETETPPAEGDETPPVAGEEPAAPAEGDPAPAVPGAPAEEGAGDEEPPPAGTPGAVQPAPPVVGADDKAIVEQFVKVGEALDERFTTSFEQQAVQQAQEDYPHYIEMLQLHPLELIGKELPSINGSDEPVTFRTADEIAQYQEAVKTILQRELEADVEQRRAGSNEVLEVVHASISMFQDNPDLVPGGKSYNKDLAIEFMRTAEPYALRMNGKLTGFSIPVQGLIDQARARVKAAPAAPAKPPAKKAAPGAKPQAGIPSKAGASGEGSEDYSPMWKALGIDSAPI